MAKADTQTTGENQVLEVVCRQPPMSMARSRAISSRQAWAKAMALSFNSNGSYTFNPGADFDSLAVGQSRDVTFTYNRHRHNGGVSAPQTVTSPSLAPMTYRWPRRIRRPLARTSARR
ncbi:hypothetical protein [Salinicola tamaricis]|uniref:hypothetical protein n=1 Tax=Salinicola tamaricis TaxID=1771309 RepID=UPI001F5C1D91|nr:hypothetical protein [Salinicola tamaricis]